MIDSQCRPCPANTTGHMSQVDDDQTVVVCNLALQTDALSSRVLSNVRVVDTNIDQPVVGVDESLILGITLVEVVCVSMRGRVRSLKRISVRLLLPREESCIQQ